MEWAQVATIIGATTALIGLQSFWIARSLDALGARIDRVEARLDRIEERVARLEARLGVDPPHLRSV